MRRPNRLASVATISRLLTILSMILAVGFSTAQAAEPTVGKKLIEWGWDEPDSAFLRANFERMEQLPFDGFVFHVVSDTGANLSWEAWGQREFKRSEFQKSSADLQAAKFRRLTHRFLRVNVAAGGIDWFDDAAWKVVLANSALSAQIAKESGCKGFMFDVEQYNKQLFYFPDQAHKDKSFDQYRAKIRQRGQEWISAVNGQFPEITILLTFGYQIAQPRTERNEKDRSQAHYGLLADFLDGVLTSCSDQTTIVDAWEQSYGYKRPEQFEKAYDTIKTKALEWTITPDRYKKHVRAGFGIWMDYDWRTHGWDVENVSKNYSPPAAFEESVRAALRVSDEYVWIYTEQPRWWTNERLPKSYVEALKKAAASRDAASVPRRGQGKSSR